MVSFAHQLKRDGAELYSEVKEIFTGSVELVEESLVRGSPITGSPGQPHDLREGQFTTVYDSEWSAVISTDDPSAPSVEAGVSLKYGGPITLNSPIGGFHSGALTEMAWPTIVETVEHRVSGNR